MDLNEPKPLQRGATAAKRLRGLRTKPAATITPEALVVEIRAWLAANAKHELDADLFIYTRDAWAVRCRRPAHPDDALVVLVSEGPLQCILYGSVDARYAKEAARIEASFARMLAKHGLWYDCADHLTFTIQA